MEVNLNLEMNYRIWNDLIKINDINNNLVELQWENLYELKETWNEIIKGNEIMINDTNKYYSFHQ